jgi:translation elongation factor EF-Ts
MSKTSSLTDFAAESEIFVNFSASVNKSLLSLKDITRIPNDLELRGPISPQIHSNNLLDVMSEMSGILTERVSVVDVKSISGDFISLYVHGKSGYSSSVGTMASAVAFRLGTSLSPAQHEVFSKFADKVARQVLATKPKYVSSSHVPLEIMAKEKEMLTNRIRDQNALEKAWVGHTKKFHSENCLMDMEWIIPSQTSQVPHGSTVSDIFKIELEALGIDHRLVLVEEFLLIN